MRDHRVCYRLALGDATLLGPVGLNETECGIAMNAAIAAAVVDVVYDGS